MKNQAILLAAGLSSRFEHGNKLLYAYNGKPLLFHAIDNLLLSSVDTIIVVSGIHLHNTRPSIFNTYTDEKLRYVVNHDPTEGMASSIRAGLSLVDSNANCLVCLGDMPLVSHITVDALIQAASTESGFIAYRPVHLGVAGNPMLFTPESIPSLQLLAGDTGAKAFIAANKTRVKNVAVDDPGIHRDFDRIADFTPIDD